MLLIVCCVLCVVRCLSFGVWCLAFGVWCFALVVWCLVFGDCRLSVICCRLLCRVVSAVCYSLFVCRRRSLFVACWLLFDAGCALLVVVCLLFVFLLIVVSCW